MAEGLVEGGRECPAATGLAEQPPERSLGVFEQLSAVADAVLYEGYLLYPYRRSSAKNRVRWQFGVLFPRDWVESDGPVVPGVSGSADSWYQQTECLLRIRRPGDASVRLRIRYLQAQRKQVEDSGHQPVASLRTDDGTVHLTFDEAVPRACEVVVPLDELLDTGRTVPVGAAAGVDVEPLPAGAGRVVRHRDEVRAETTVTAERLSDDLCRLRVRTANTGPAPDGRTARDEALRRALIATHTLIGGDGVEFVSLTDPPTDLAAPARSCRNEFTFPVLGGEAEDAGHLLLSAPIILPDHPQVAPESPGDLHDAAEIDEILTLRTMLLTDEEKREARATDPRAAAILDRVDTMPQEVFERLHGAVRSLAPVAPAAAPATAERPAWWQEGADGGLSPTTDTVLVDGVPLGGGSRVRLRPRGRGADAQDMFLAGRTAEVAAVFHDVDGSVHLAVTLDDDPASELHTWYGRFHYFRPDELEPLEPAGTPDEPSAPAPVAAKGPHKTDSETPAAEAE
ncbi:hypothetical protein [Streptomyces purpurascens]|uniref:hypothetical protein n=1 Tax=Streptomyces purpurascens TaxID=1924 RepID=UPI001672B247|nr:hypothetical protein [Streptomyces purpurascens]MCE7051549.1 hypothetical protein [Streptomyces purpurascens]GHA24404.1 hypothetical protein GCM10010303_38650 [Streptomyces purpurascens]